MVRQLQHVLKTYVTRKLLWPLAAMYALTIWYEANAPIRQTPLLWNKTQNQWMPRKEFKGLTAFLDWQASDDELRELRGLTIHGGFVERSDEERPDGKKQASYKRDDDVLPEHLAKLSKCVQLTELHWYSVKLSPEVGQTLSKLPQLRQLELTLIGDPTPSIQHLPAMPALELFQLPAIPAVELGLLAKHERLRTIVLQDSIPPRPLLGSINTSPYEIWRQPSTLHLATQVEQVIIKPASEHDKAVSDGVDRRSIPQDASFKTVPISESLRTALTNLPNLVAVEVRDPWGEGRARMVDDPGLQQAFSGRPDIAINPLAFDSQSLLSPFAGLGSVTLVLILGMQLFSHFSTVASHTIPSFAKTHLIVAATLLIVHVAMLVNITMVRRDVACVPAIALTLAFPAIGILVTSLLSLRPAALPFIFPVAFGGIMTMVIAGPAMANFLGGKEFFSGNLPGRALAILLCEIVAVVFAGRSLILLPRTFSEAGIPLGLGFKQSMQYWHTLQRKQDRPSVSVGLLNTKLFERRLETFLACERNANSSNGHKTFDVSRDPADASPQSADPRPARRWAVQQWQAGEPGNNLGLLLMCLFGPWIMVGIHSLVFGLMSGEMIGGKLFVFHSVAAGTLSLTIATFAISLRTYSRRPVLAQELLRPMKRSELIQHLRSTIWVDLRPSIFVTFGYLLFLLLIHSWGPLSWSSQSLAEVSFTHAILVLAMPLPIWGGTVFLLSVRNEIWKGTVISLSAFAMALATQIYAMVRLIGATHFPIDPPTVTLASCWLAIIFVVLGFAFAWWGNRRLLQVEWGLTG